MLGPGDDGRLEDMNGYVIMWPTSKKSLRFSSRVRCPIRSLRSPRHKWPPSLILLVHSPRFRECLELESSLQNALSLQEKSPCSALNQQHLFHPSTFDSSICHNQLKATSSVISIQETYSLGLIQVRPLFATMLHYQFCLSG